MNTRVIHVAWSACDSGVNSLVQGTPYISERLRLSASFGVRTVILKWQKPSVVGIFDMEVKLSEVGCERFEF